jgi:halimadienyl-diphosphate synthase
MVLVPATAEMDDLRRETTLAGQEVLRQAAADDFGAVTPSVYETSRILRTARWLAGHGSRLRFVVRSQNPDGSWGQPDGYDLVPTLAATEALLAELREPPAEGAPTRGELLACATAGLRALRRWLDRPAQPPPDTIGVETLAPWLIAEINGQLARLVTDPVAGLDGWEGAALPPLAGLDDGVRHALREAVRGGHGLPHKYWHGLEVLGSEARRAPFVHPTAGVVGSSPAATAAWLGPAPPADDPSARYLDALQRRHGGPVPGVAPITVFERAWVVCSLAGSGMTVVPPPSVVEHLRGALGPTGAPAGSSLMTDADDTAGVLHALALAGWPQTSACLRAYQGNEYFLCIVGERTPSTSTNAHVLDALLDDVALDAWHRPHAAIGTVTDWLLAQQDADGSWLDKWHASRYYATACAVLALRRVRSRAAAHASRRAVGWVLRTQRPDGSWGRWTGTAEETAYGVQVLLSEPDGVTEPVARAALEGLRFLAAHRRGGVTDAPLWHDKDLYTPVTVVAAATLAAMYQAASCPQVRRLSTQLAVA